MRAEKHISANSVTGRSDSASDRHSDIVAGQGMRKRLMFAFLGISSLVVVAATIAILSLWANAKGQDRISRQSIPIATIALDLTRTAQKIVGSVPLLITAGSVDEQEWIKRELAAEVERLDALLDSLHQYDIDPRAASSINRAALQFSANIEVIDRVVSARLAVARSQNSLIVLGEQAVARIAKVLEAEATNDVFRVLTSDTQTARQQFRLTRATGKTRELALLLKMQVSAGVEEAQDAIAQIKQTLLNFDPTLTAKLEDDLIVLSSLYDGSNSWPQQEAFRLQLESAAGKALEENSDLANRFAEAVNRMIGVAKADVSSANIRASSVQTMASWLLISVVGITLISTLLIIRFYVQRNILARLTDLTSSMMAIANGNLGAEIPQGSDDELGSMAQALRVFRDTAVKARDSNLREISEVRNRLDHAIESIQEGFALFDGKDRLVLSNSQFGKLLFDGADLPSADTSYKYLIKQMLASEVIVGDTAPQEWLDRTLENHREPTGSMLVQLKNDRWINATERRTEDGGTVMVVTDITALKRHERELDELVERLRSASAAKSSFIANVSHELRTPLTAILGFSHIIQGRLDKTIFPKVDAAERPTARAVSQVRQNIDIMIREGERLTKMINDVLDLEKIEAGQMVWNTEDLDIGAIIEQAVAATTSLYKQKNLELQVNIEEMLPKAIGDHDRLVQVVINLISNAVKFTDRGHVVCRAMRGDGSFVSVSVTDTGSGISPEDQTEVFDKFRQVGDTLTEKPTGTGLGLPICREIVEHLGGSITVESILGFGSTFTFQIPTANSGAAAIKQGTH